MPFCQRVIFKQKINYFCPLPLLLAALFAVCSVLISILRAKIIRNSITINPSSLRLGHISCSYTGLSFGKTPVARISHGWRRSVAVHL